MNKKLKILSYLLIIALIGAIIVVLVYSGKKTEQTNPDRTQISIMGNNPYPMLGKTELKNMINSEIDSTEVEPNMALIENKLNKNPYIKNAEVYRSIDGGIQAQITLKEPIARIYEKSGSSYYIDKNGEPIPLKENWTHHIMVINGEWKEPYAERVGKMHLEEWKQKSLLDDAAYLTEKINQSSFHKALIEQIYVNPDMEFECIPILGRSSILLGDTSNTVGKLNKLETFYREGLSYKGFNDYTQINLKYKNQIICNK